MGLTTYQTLHKQINSKNKERNNPNPAQKEKLLKIEKINRSLDSKKEIKAKKYWPKIDHVSKMISLKFNKDQ